MFCFVALFCGWTQLDKGGIWASFPLCGIHDSKNKVTKTIPQTQTLSGLCVPEEWRGVSWRSFFQTCATPRCHLHPWQAARVKAQSCPEPPWQDLMFQVHLASGHPPKHKPAHKNTLWGERCTSAFVSAGQCPPNTSNASVCFGLMASKNRDNLIRLIHF